MSKEFEVKKTNISDEKIDYIIKKMKEFRDIRVGEQTEVEEETIKLLAEDLRNLCDEAENESIALDEEHDDAYYNNMIESILEQHAKETQESNESMGNLYEESSHSLDQEILLDENDIADFYSKYDNDDPSDSDETKLELSDAAKQIIETGHYLNFTVATGEGRRLASLEMNKETKPHEIFEANKAAVTLCYKYLLENFDSLSAKGFVQGLKEFLETLNEETIDEKIDLLS